MALITEAEVRALGHRKAVVRYKSAAAILQEDRAAGEFSAVPQSYTIFLSHAFRDQILILGLREYLQSDDRELDRSNVAKTTAQRLRSRMQQSRNLFFATTQKTSESRWMPWELGYFDACRHRCAILPLAQAPHTEDSYAGQEYLGLYPYIVRTPMLGSDVLFVHTDKHTWVKFDDWLLGEIPTPHS